jgi:hypothetical protein
LLRVRKKRRFSEIGGEGKGLPGPGSLIALTVRKGLAA